MPQDEIMREVRHLRDKKAAKHNYSVRALYEEAKVREKKTSRKVVRLEPRRLKPEPAG